MPGDRAAASRAFDVDHGVAVNDVGSNNIGRKLDQVAVHNEFPKTLVLVGQFLYAMNACFGGAVIGLQ